ncbi:potassium-transporting ATPase subunit KdpC [Corynebacterium neomassiliense]|uniref:potassium-transporting ATPase subunit KdpC n=1 Tax=Corynebacterium neomassiliense TaxID=2079482 RepID=UPI00102FD5AF|nr:potassium-transporting ATPase subunit KdpC [Corynebacterium neomassiliense]
MSSSVLRGARNLRAAGRMLVILTVLLGVLYPLLVTGIGQLFFPSRANGSLLEEDGRTVGSSLIGQSFTDDSGSPLRRYFQSRPSAAGDRGYDASASGGTNLGPENPALIADITARRAGVAALEGVRPEDVPADAVTSSASGLDPHISPAYAAIQVRRVAAARGMDEDAVRDLVATYTEESDLGFIGDPVVNVVTLNLALDRAEQDGR